MSVTLVSPPTAETETAEQRFVMGGIRWDTYVRFVMRSTNTTGFGWFITTGN
jgi:hypothetical protein